MISLKNADGSRVIVLDDVDLRTLRMGPLATPHLLVGFSPDLTWTAAAFEEAEASGELTTEKILAILATSIVKPAPGET